MSLFIILLFAFIPYVQSLDSETNALVFSSDKFNIREGYANSQENLCEYETTLCMQYYVVKDRGIYTQFNFLFEHQPDTIVVNGGNNFEVDVKPTDFDLKALTNSTVLFLIATLNSFDLPNNPINKCHTIGNSGSVASSNLAIIAYATNLGGNTCKYFKDHIFDIKKIYDMDGNVDKLDNQLNGWWATLIVFLAIMLFCSSVSQYR